MEQSTKLRPDENRIPTGLPGGFFIYNADAPEDIWFAEDNVIKLFGCETMEEFREYTGNSFRGMVHPEDLDKIQNSIKAQTMTDEKRHDYVRYRIITKQGTVHYVEDFGHLLHGKDGMKFFYVYIVDVDKDEYYNRGRNSLAETEILSMNMNVDRLTGLYNMSTFYQKVQDLLGDVGRDKNKEISFIHFDIVNFKRINEQFGFPRGDDLLCRMAYVIRDIFTNSIVARFSNDHFAVCTEIQDVVKFVKQVHGRMLRMVDGTKVEIRAGIYQLEEDCEVGVACDHARMACSAAKMRYDVIYSIYDEKLHEKLLMQQYIVDHVDEAVEKEYIKVYYQPVMRVDTGEICGYEALARWIDPKYGFLSPADFIGVLENFRLIYKMDSFIIKKVCEDYCMLLDRGEPIVPVSVNLSRLDFELCNIIEVIESYCYQYGVPRDMLDFEITESALNEKEIDLITECKNMHDRGFQVWLDDFGSGYSSLNTLIKYDFDVLKLDLEFLRSYDKNIKAGMIIGYIISAARELGIQTLTEGVETQEHYDFLRDIGCNKAQGYYFSKPMPLEEVREMAKKKGMNWEKHSVSFI